MLVGIIPHGPSIVLGLEFLMTCPFPKSHLPAFCMPSPALYSACPQSVARTVYFRALVRSAKGPEGGIGVMVVKKVGRSTGKSSCSYRGGRTRPQAKGAGAERGGVLLTRAWLWA